MRAVGWEGGVAYRVPTCPLDEVAPGNNGMEPGTGAVTYEGVGDDECACVAGLHQKPHLDSS